MENRQGMRRLIFVLLTVMFAAGMAAGRQTSDAGQTRRRAELILVYVIDGLRPDSINAQDTPNLHRLKREGVEYINSHAAFPTVTRVNSAVIATGVYPQKNGLVGNAMYVPAVDPVKAFNTQDHQALLRMKRASGGKLLFVPTLAERLVEKGLVFVAIGSGSPGSTFLLNPAAVDGKGVVINGEMQPAGANPERMLQAAGGAAAYPERINARVIALFGPPPVGKPAALIDWTERVFRDYVLAELRPAVVINWHTQPDSAQHRYGVGSPEGLEALRSADAYVGQALAKLNALGAGARAGIIVVSDHGFALHSHEVNVTGALVSAGLKSGRDSDDLVVASNGQTLALHVKGRNAARIRRICEFLQRQDWADVIFTPAVPGSHGPRRVPEQGWVPGTFAMELVRMANPERGPDIVVTLPWSSLPNAAGFTGTHYTTGNSDGVLRGSGSGHGGISPALVRNTLIAWGPDFRRGSVIGVPGGNVDVAPTILALLGHGGAFDGRVLDEAFTGGPDPNKIAVSVRTVETNNRKGYRAVLQLSEVGTHWYIDKAWRLRE